MRTDPKIKRAMKPLPLHRAADGELALGPAPLRVGDRVKPSAYSLRDKWSYYLGLGDYARKSRARDVYDTAAAARGTITAVVPPSGAMNCATCDTYHVQWDDGRVSYTMPYMIERERR